MSITDFMLLVKNVLVYAVLNTIKQKEKILEKSRFYREHNKEKLKAEKSINTHVEVIQLLFNKIKTLTEKLNVLCVD